MAINKRVNNSGSVSYLVRVRDRSGQWYPTRSFKRKTDAEVHERELLSKRDAGSTAEHTFKSEVPFCEYVKLWQRDCRGRVSDGWKYSQDQMLRDHILPIVGQSKMSKITSADIGQVLRAMELKELSAQSRRHAYNLLNHILSAACGYHQWIQWNPVSKRDRPTVSVSEREVLKPEQSRRLLVASRDSPIGPAIWISVLAGLRPNEIQGLRWKAVDFEANMIRIVAGYKRKMKVLEPFPKQKKHGSSPMVPALRDYLLKLSSGKNPDDFVVSGVVKPMLDYGTYNAQLKRQCRAIGLPEITPHSLRHSCTEIWCDFGASEEDIVRLLNQSGSGAVRRYIHKTPERLLRIANGISFGMEPVAPTTKLQLVR